MARTAVALLFVAFAQALAPARAVALQEPSPGEPPPREGVQEPQRRERIEAARERWERMSPEEREALRRRFEALEGMDECERGELRERFRRMREVEEHVRERMSEDIRRKLALLTPDERREVLRALVERELEMRGRALRDMLPREWRHRLESATPDDRGRLLQDFQEHHRSRAVDEFARRLELPGAEVARLKALPPEALWDELLELRRAELRARIAREGVPSWISAEEWAEWDRLPTREFFERAGAKKLRSHGRPGLEGLMRLLRPDPAWLLELAHLPLAERRTAVEARLRERVLAGLERHPDLFTPGELAGLRALPTRELVERVRERAAEKGLDGRGERWKRWDRYRHRGRPGPGGPPPDGEDRGRPWSGDHRSPGERPPPGERPLQGERPPRRF